MTAPTDTAVAKSGTGTGGYATVTWTDTGQDANWTRYIIRISEVPLFGIQITVDAASFSVETPVILQNRDATFYVEEEIDNLDGTYTATAGNTDVLSAVTDIDAYYVVTSAFRDDSTLALDPTGSTSVAVSDDFTVEKEREVLNVMGRGRKVNYGTSFGESGSLSLQVRGATHASQITVLEQAKALTTDGLDYWIMTPFGEAKSVTFGDMGFKRLAGVGPIGMGEVSLPYTEVGHVYPEG